MACFKTVPQTRAAVSHWLCLGMSFEFDCISRILHVRHRGRVPTVEVRRHLYHNSIPPVWSFWGWANQGPPFAHTASRSGGQLKTWAILTWIPQSSATCDGERTGWESLPSSYGSIQLVMPAQPVPCECRHKFVWLNGRSYQYFSCNFGEQGLCTVYMQDSYDPVNMTENPYDCTVAKQRTL